jgi:hypothetical protein
MTTQRTSDASASYKRKYSSYSAGADDAASSAHKRRSTDSSVTRQEALASLALYREMDRIFASHFVANSSGGYSTYAQLNANSPPQYPVSVAPQQWNSAPMPPVSSETYSTANFSPSSDAAGYDPDHELEFELNTNMGMVWRDVPKPSPPTSVAPMNLTNTAPNFDTIYNATQAVSDPLFGFGPSPDALADADAMFGNLSAPLPPAQAPSHHTNPALEQLSSLGNHLQAEAERQMRCVAGEQK